MMRERLFPARRPGAFGWLGVAVCAAALALAGCADYRFQGGLASVPNINRPWTSDDFAHDVIANGNESCPRSGRPEDDRLFRRFPPCGFVITSPWRPPPPPAAPPPEPRQGLPPVAERRTLR